MKNYIICPNSPSIPQLPTQYLWKRLGTDVMWGHYFSVYTSIQYVCTVQIFAIECMTFIVHFNPDTLGKILWDSLFLLSSMSFCLHRRADAENTSEEKLLSTTWASRSENVGGSTSHQLLYQESCTSAASVCCITELLEAVWGQTTV
jgi:hypothetical protein